MAHALITGVEGRVHAANSVHANTGVWSIDPSDQVQKIITSATRGAAVLYKGNEDWSGSFQANGVVPTIFPGDQFQFDGIIQGAGVPEGETEHAVSGLARCNELVIDIDYQSGEAMGFVTSFQSDGALTYAEDGDFVPAGAQDADAFIVAKGNILPVKFTKMPAAPAWGDTLADVKKVTITLTSNNIPRITSSTAGIVLHDRGTPDAKVSIEVMEGAPLMWWKNGEVYALRVYNTSGTWYEFQFLYVEKLSGVQVDPNSNEYVGVTYEMGFCSVAAADAADTPGKIVKPSTSNWYPYS